jgi:hypothetical protein
MSTADDGSLRAGNTDRERVVAQLNAAFAEGRLDVGELDERVAAAYAAKTLGELVPLTADLPATQPRRAATPARRQDAQPVRHQDGDAARWAGAGGALSIFLVCTLIWGAIALGQGHLSYFWPIWTAIPLVFAVVGAIGMGSAQRRGRGDRR